MFKNNDDVLTELKEQKESHLKMALEMGRIGSALVDIQKMMTKTLQTYTSEVVVLQTYSQTYRANDYLYNSLTVGDSAQADNAKLIIDGIVPSFTIPLLAGINSVNIPDGATYTVSTTSGNPVTAVLTRYNTPGDNDTNVTIQGTVKMTDSSGVTFSAKNPADGTIIPAGNILGVTSFGEFFNGSTYDRARSAGGLDAQPATGIAASHNYLFNGSTYDRAYNNVQNSLLPSSARTTATASSTVLNYNCRGVVVFLNVTAASGTGGLTVNINYVDPIQGGTWGVNTVPTPVTATGEYMYVVYPGASSATNSVKQVTSLPLPRLWNVYMAVGDASSYTYSVSYAYIL